jgi:hypothetical protein
VPFTEVAIAARTLALLALDYAGATR